MKGRKKICEVLTKLKVYLSYSVSVAICLCDWKREREREWVGGKERDFST